MRKASAPPRATVDTNIVVSGTAFGGLPLRLLDAWRAGAFILLVTAAQRSEIADVLARPHIAKRLQATDQRITLLLTELDEGAELVTPLADLPLPVRDPKDEPILAAALGGNADYLITGDNDLLVLADDPRVAPLRIVTAAAFLAMLDPDGVTT